MERPASVTTFGILNIVFAAVGFFGLLASIALYFAPATSHNPVVRIMHENPAYMTWIILTIPMGLISCGVLLAAGIGLLLLKPWARILSIGYAIYAVLFGLLGTVLNSIFLLPSLLEEASRRQGPEAAGAIGGAVGGTIGGCVGLIYPILLLIFMTRPKLKEAFRPPGAPF
jgi:hypothetical protein